MGPSNRQLKLLRFFGIEVDDDCSVGAAGWEIGQLMSHSENRDLWRRYIYVTGDTSQESPHPVDVQPSDLLAADVPDEFDYRAAVRAAREEMVEQLLDGASPFDVPQPPVRFSGRAFLFTGKFDFGDRKACKQAVEAKGGTSAKSVTSSLDYLVVGTKGSPTWKKGRYGAKIERAVALRRTCGAPAVISEEHWKRALRRRRS